MSHWVNNAKTNIRETHTCNILTESHTLSALGSILNSTTKWLWDNFNSFEVEHIGKLPCALCDVTLNSVSECVHTCCGSKPLWHCWHHIRVNNCDYRNIVNINANHLSVLFNICNYIVDCYLCGSTCCCGNCDNRHSLVLCGSNSLKWTNIGKFGVVDDNADSLCCIHWRTAADCNDTISTAFLKHLNTVLNIFNCRVRLDIRVKCIFNACIFKHISNFFGNSEFYKVRVWSNKNLFKTSAVYFIRNGVNSSCSVIWCFIKYKSVHYNHPLQKYQNKSAGYIVHPYS